MSYNPQTAIIVPLGGSFLFYKITFIYPQFNWGFTHAFSADNEKGAGTISSACSFFTKSCLFLGSESCYLCL